MSNDAFDGQILAEKLSKLNNSQQSIESLSHWCISHRKKARHIVETWDKLFNSCQREQRVSFLYLANDILQNSRRKGSEFVNEFWKVLPAALKHVYDNGDEYGKKAVTRLVDIWEERKVFGSRAQGLKDEILGKNSPPSVASNGKSSSTIKIVKRDAHSVRIKLAIGGLPEKILTAFQSVLDEHLNEEAALNKCNAALSHMGKIREEAENATPGNQHGLTLVNELQELENVLQQWVGQLESAEATRSILVSQLKEALQDQESKLELIHAQLQVARGQIEQASSLRKRLTSVVPGSSTGTTTIPVAEAIRVTENNLLPVQPTNSLPQPLLAQPVVSFAPLKTMDEDSKKAAAAAVAAKLAASTSSAQMLTSVLSSFVAEEAASMNSRLMFYPAEKRQKPEKPMPAPEISNSDGSNAGYFTSLQQQPGTGVAVIPLSTSMQPISQSSQLQSSFGALPPLPPPPPLSPANAAANQYVHSAGMTGVMPYGYGGNALPPLPLFPPHIAMGFQTPQHSPPQQQQSSATGGCYRPPGIGFYGQNHQATPPPLPRQ